jgi:hypothetical protein
MSRSSVLVSGLRLLAVALGAAFLFGCGGTALPVIPKVPESPAAGPPVLLVEEDGTPGYTGADTLEAAWEQGENMSRALTVSKEITPKGGWIQCGRFLLVVPDSSLDSTATITITMPDTTAMVCDLDIQPARLNRFKNPVLLSLNTTGTATDAEELSIYWYDPSGRTWLDMNCEKDLATTKMCLDTVVQALNDVTAPDLTAGNVTGLSTHLSHFSRYSAGKAGW